MNHYILNYEAWSTHGALLWDGRLQVGIPDKDITDAINIFERDIREDHKGAARIVIKDIFKL